MGLELWIGGAGALEKVGWSCGRGWSIQLGGAASSLQLERLLIFPCLLQRLQAARVQKQPGNKNSPVHNWVTGHQNMGLPSGYFMKNRQNKMCFPHVVLLGL